MRGLVKTRRAAVALLFATSILVPMTTAYAVAPTCNGVPATIVGTAGDEVILGTSGPDVIVGKGGDDVIKARGGNDIVCGNGGNDTLIGGGGADLLFGNSGNDVLRGERGADMLAGGSGTDTASFRKASKRVVVKLAAGIAKGEGADTLVSIENIEGSAYGDRLIGNGKANLIKGLAGNDIINGKGGNDTIKAAGGNDTANGGPGDDTINGGPGTDTLTGDAGNDTCTYGEATDCENRPGSRSAITPDGTETTTTLPPTTTTTTLPPTTTTTTLPPTTTTTTLPPTTTTTTLPPTTTTTTLPPTTTTTTLPPTTTTTTLPPTTTTTTLPPTTTTTTTTTTVPPLPGFGPGTQLVGADLDAGRYIAENVSGCYWERLSGVGGTFDEIIANDNVDGRAIVDISGEDVAFNSTRCGDWVIVQPVEDPPSSTMGQGSWQVGIDIAPGRWSTTSEVDGCYWQRVSSFSGEFAAIIANDNVDGRAIVDISANDVGFESTRCGDWVIVQPVEDPPSSTMGQGSWQVGIDIAPGRWSTTSEVDGCYWQRVSSFSGEFAAIIANDNVDGRAIVDISANDVGFESTRCGDWVIVQPVEDPPSSTMGQGSWQVGIDIAPGRWSTTSEVDGCYWQRVSSFSGEFAAIIANDNVDGRAIVDISANDVGFESTRCGDWELVE